MAAETSPQVERAYERLVNISADEEKRLEYEAREKAIRDYNYLMDYNLKKGLEAGMEKGIKEGRIEGRKEGRKEGRIEGMEEGLEQGAKALIEMCQEDSYSREETSSRLVHRLSVSRERAEEYLKKYWLSEKE